MYHPASFFSYLFALNIYLMIKIGIRARLTAGMISAVVVITLIIVGYFSIHNRSSDKQSAFENINNTCDKISSQIVGRLNVGLGRTRSLTGSFEALRDLKSSDKDAFIYPFLMNAMRANRDYLAFWISFELSYIDPAFENMAGRKTWLVDRLNDSLVSRFEYRGILWYTRK